MFLMTATLCVWPMYVQIIAIFEYRHSSMSSVKGYQYDSNMSLDKLKIEVENIQF